MPFMLSVLLYTVLHTLYLSLFFAFHYICPRSACAHMADVSHQKVLSKIKKLASHLLRSCKVAIYTTYFTNCIPFANPNCTYGFYESSNLSWTPHHEYKQLGYSVYWIRILIQKETSCPTLDRCKLLREVRYKYGNLSITGSSVADT